MTSALRSVSGSVCSRVAKTPIFLCLWPRQAVILHQLGYFPARVEANTQATTLISLKPVVVILKYL
jgi:hypothetical protein